MDKEKIKVNMVKCEACGKEVSRTEIRHLSLRTCCSVIQVPLCPECWGKIQQSRSNL